MPNGGKAFQRLLANSAFLFFVSHNLLDAFLNRILVDLGTTRGFPNPRLPNLAVGSIVLLVKSFWANLFNFTWAGWVDIEVPKPDSRP